MVFPICKREISCCSKDLPNKMGHPINRIPSKRRIASGAAWNGHRVRCNLRPSPISEFFWVVHELVSVFWPPNSFCQMHWKNVRRERLNDSRCQLWAESSWTGGKWVGFVVASSPTPDSMLNETKAATYIACNKGLNDDATTDDPVGKVFAYILTSLMMEGAAATAVNDTLRPRILPAL